MLARMHHMIFAVHAFFMLIIIVVELLQHNHFPSNLLVIPTRLRSLNILSVFLLKRPYRHLIQSQ